MMLLTLCVTAYSQNTILWKVSDTLNQKTSYIVGTFHQFGKNGKYQKTNEQT